jgi:hypothetical protein
VVGVGIARAHRHPQRQLGPGRDVVREEHVVVYPDQPRARPCDVGAVLEPAAHRGVGHWRGGVERASSDLVAAVEHEGGQVARVDELHRDRRVAGREHVAARAIRSSHHGTRPTFSCGPMIRPALTMVERSPSTSLTARSQPAFRTP